MNGDWGGGTLVIRALELLAAVLVAAFVEVEGEPDERFGRWMGVRIGMDSLGGGTKTERTEKGSSTVICFTVSICGTRVNEKREKRTLGIC